MNYHTYSDNELAAIHVGKRTQSYSQATEQRTITENWETGYFQYHTQLCCLMQKTLFGQMIEEKTWQRLWPTDFLERREKTSRNSNE